MGYETPYDRARREMAEQATIDIRDKLYGYTPSAVKNDETFRGYFVPSVALLAFAGLCYLIIRVVGTGGPHWAHGHIALIWFLWLPLGAAALLGAYSLLCAIVCGIGSILTFVTRGRWRW